MAFRSTLELYSAVILPRLAEGPKTIDEMDVPQYAAEHLKVHGLIKARWFRVRSVAVEVWFLPEDLAALQEVEDLRRFNQVETPAPPLMNCWELSEQDWPDDF